MSAGSEIATFASGCFWGTEHIFIKHFPPNETKGIIRTSVGYTGGNDTSHAPTYPEVCTGLTGFAEAVRIEFNPNFVTYGELVGGHTHVLLLTSFHQFFYRTHDPTSHNSQGRNHGTQYRSEIFTHSPAQATAAREVTAAVQAKHFDPKGTTIVTQISEAGPWFDAEDYHQRYLEHNPTGYHCPTHRLWW